ncbi:ribosomal-protein-alanine N-acetyltransferase [Natranaerovirga pectinivora]|uniref:Ribosomal-protein-alanine N-acetyltransferase n=1 Tax=Natranaerovirga pectinivora TaxID=682400 RepID=A0A4R3MLQ1_9FIRM|nr:GNAT family N-acetyltransferase [Natranaerovirga pectinivora]TCT15626.1 ribosomal-protein-alanine N-acetyltransferase [Natranaerovirga pectinivora]
MKTLETERLTMRDWKVSDIFDFYEYASVEGISEMTGWPHHENIEVTKTILKDFIDSGIEYALVLKEKNKVIGSLGFHNRTVDTSYRADIQREIGYVLSKAYWGRGLMTEAVREAIQYAFDEIKVDVLWCGHKSFNLQSKRVIEKSGFRYYCDGTYESFDKTYDVKKYILTKDDYHLLFPK